MKKKRTKIVCTLGPATENPDIIEQLVDAGMNVARLNFSHGTYEHHGAMVEHIRSVATKTGEPIAIMQDLQGPKMRLGELPESGVPLKKGDVVVFDTAIDVYEGGAIPVGYNDLHSIVNDGERMLFDDGRIEVSVDRIEGTKIHTTGVVPGALKSHKGINIPDSKISVSALTEKDKKDARFGVEHDVDIIALSFVTQPKDILDLRYLLKQYEEEGKRVSKNPIRIIAKIERNEAVDRIDEILDVADGIMVARGDLGIEVPAEEVPLIQKKLIDKALAAAKPVIVATQMLDSMQSNPRPTRAEVSDVSNAVIDHADAVMLSNETAVGEYPMETVKTMATIISETEKSAYDDLHIVENKKKEKVDEVLSRMSRVLAEEVKAKIILAASLSGETGRLISRNRPELPIIVATATQRVRNQLNLSWGVIPFILVPCRTIEELVERSVAHLKESGIVESEDTLIVVAGEPVGQAGHVNLLEVREVS